jgi:copper(I)-binding protein
MRRRAALALALALLLGGCVHYPTVEDIGGVRIRTEKGKAVRQGEGVVVYFEVVSTGKFGDIIENVAAPLARQARLVDAGGAPLTPLEVPGATTMKFAADGPPIILDQLTRPLTPGETIIVTLLFQKSGGIGIVTLVE